MSRWSRHDMEASRSQKWKSQKQTFLPPRKSCVFIYCYESFSSSNICFFQISTKGKEITHFALLIGLYSIHKVNTKNICLFYSSIGLYLNHKVNNEIFSLRNTFSFSILKSSLRLIMRMKPFVCFACTGFHSQSAHQESHRATAFCELSFHLLSYLLLPDIQSFWRPFSNVWHQYQLKVFRANAHNFNISLGPKSIRSVQTFTNFLFTKSELIKF